MALIHSQMEASPPNVWVMLSLLGRYTYIPIPIPCTRNACKPRNFEIFSKILTTKRKCFFTAKIFRD